MLNLELSTFSWYRSAAERHIIPALGRVRLDKLTPVMIEAFLTEKVKNGRLDGTGGLGASSIRRLRITLHKTLDAAVRKGLLARNPMDLVDRPKSPNPDTTIDVWSPEDLKVFIAKTIDHRLGPIWRLASMSGLRRSELCGLQWPDVDLESGVLSIRRAVVIVDGRPHVKDPKTTGSRRTVDLDRVTVAALREWRTRQLRERIRAGSAWVPGDWVVTNEIGSPLRPDYVSRLFDRAAATAELPRITIRQLRHSHATALLRAGIHPKVVQERLGHSSIQITLDTYSAVLPNMQRDAVERLARLFDTP